jgi:hypothetical protein
MRKLTSLHLKIIALITMIIDHIGLFLLNNTTTLYVVFRIIGRISLPLYAFLIVEGITKSSKPLKYLLRMLLIGIIFDFISYIVMEVPVGTTLTTFSLSGLMLYFLTHKDFRLKFLSIIPIGITILSLNEIIPLSISYGLYGFILVIIFYLANRFGKLIYNKNKLIDEQYLISFITVTFFVFYSCLLYAFGDQLLHAIPNTLVDYKMQTYSLIASIFILCYNGNRGYNSPLIKWGFYIAYPLHVVILYVIYYIIILV